MARALSAYLSRDNVPARKPLQQAIDALKLPLKLDSDYVPFETSGYLPCTLDGEDAGFDLRFGDVAEDVSTALNLGERNVALNLKWGGDPREEAAALIFCAALANDFDAVVQGTEALSVKQLVAKARSLLEG
ncbi:hypothetical protein [Methylocystis bryophila]|uniref:Uncharacterized protein n=1 Tax=Methylocystis bryophila TaxID=655015 RepID=A0A1W6MTV4_9HYPH|nr:hypothetical protein [Methylocystis bryophila]ARN80992.1 hypothetical protein B1812_07805 [Methylocystis bryophila]BDV36904.1 hypothetical protein DSM21852_01570 [Methylocystis bryophila]